MAQLPIDVYGRKSRKGDDRQRSTEGQVDDCTARLHELGYPVGEVFVDEGKSAWNPRVKRLDWHKLMARLEAGLSGGVIVFDLERFSRRPIEGERLIQAAERGLIVLDSERDYDLTSADGKAAFRDHMKMAAYYSDRQSTKVKRGKRLRAMKGESNHSVRPFGFEDNGVTAREPEAVVIRELAERMLAGEKQNALIRELNERGVTTSMGGAWNPRSIQKVLIRPRNAGRATYHDAVVGELSPDPILDPETFDLLVAKFAAQRRGRPNSEKYLCSGIARCGLCGHPLNGRARSHLPPYPDGGVRRHYGCLVRAHGGGCGRISVDQRALDGHVGALVVRMLADPEHAAALEVAARAVADERQQLDAEITELDHTAQELAGRLGRGEIPLARFDAATAPLDRRLAELRDRRAVLPAYGSAKNAKGASQAVWRQRWDDATTSERRVYLRQALQGRRLVVMPADPKGPRVFDPGRVRLELT